LWILVLILILILYSYYRISYDLTH
jgi:hypothetical protein